MAKQNAALIAFNRGIVSPFALARIDLARMRYSAEEQTNYIPRSFGPMMLRPGFGWIGHNTHFNNKTYCIPFIPSTDEAMWLEISDSTIRPFVGEDNIHRLAVATTITNGTFTGSLAGWTNNDQPGATSAYDAPNQMGLTGTGTNGAIEYQAVAVAAPDQTIEHAIRIVINRGPVGLRIGTTLAGDELVRETQLGVGTHSLAFTPNAATFYIYFFNRQARKVDVGSVAIEAAGPMVLPGPWTEAQLPLLRYDQSADVMFICDGSQQQRQIERRGPRSWSVVLYAPEDGPYRAINFAPVTLTPSAIKGDISLVASAPVFNTKHVGALFRLASLGQDVQNTLAGVNQFSDTIRTTGVGVSRNWTLVVSTIGTNILKLQRSADPDNGFINVGTITANGTYVENDGLDNQIIYHRVIMTTYNGGSTLVELSFTGGSINGDVRITGVSDNENATATVLNPLGGVTPTNTWYEGAWSDFRGWPTSLALSQDRLWNFGLGSFWGSIVDEYAGFDDTTVGDSGPISRTIGKGPVDWVNWGMSLSRLLVGTDGVVISARSDSIDTPLTPTNFNLKWPISKGTARLAPVVADDDGYFVHRNLLDLYEVSFDTSNYIRLDYGATRATAICPEVCFPGIVKVVVQQMPDLRIHCILSDGTVAMLVRDKIENVDAWIKLETPGAGGLVEDAVVLPGVPEDLVYYVVNRTIGGVTSRMYEKWAKEDDCDGGGLNKQADAYVIYNDVPATVLTAIAPHLAGQEVIVWADGNDLSPGPYPSDPLTNPRTYTAQKTYTVAGDGTVTLDVAVSRAVIGLPYEARFMGVKLAYAAQMGTALTMRKNVTMLGLVAANLHSDGMRFGPDYDNLDRMPRVEEGAPVPYDTVWPEYDKIGFKFGDKFGPDTRICLKSYAPRPARIMGLVPSVSTEQ